MNLNLSRIKKPHKGLSGSPHCLINNPKCSCGMTEDGAGGSGSPQTLLLSPDFSLWNHSLQSPLYCIWEVKCMLGMYPSKLKETAFSQAHCLSCCDDADLCPTYPPWFAYPKILPLHLPLSCFITDAFLVFPSHSICAALEQTKLLLRLFIWLRSNFPGLHLGLGSSISLLVLLKPAASFPHLWTNTLLPPAATF